MGKEARPDFPPAASAHNPSWCPGGQGSPVAKGSPAAAMATRLGASLVPGGASGWACPIPGLAPPPHQPGKCTAPSVLGGKGVPTAHPCQKPTRPPESLGPCQTPGRKQSLQGLPPTWSMRARLTPGTLSLGPDLPDLIRQGLEPGGALPHWGSWVCGRVWGSARETQQALRLGHHTAEGMG